MIAAAAVLLATCALLVAALAHVRDDEQDGRLDAVERDADRAALDPLPPEVEPETPRSPIGFRR